MPNLSASVRRATETDAGALAELVNRAYAIEATFVEGDRTNATEISELVRKGTFVVLEQDHDLGLAAAVYVEPGYFGMLSVLPELQGMGLGTRQGCTEVNLKIINLREELGRWYRSLGYREVGTAPYGHRAVKQPCHFVEMRKRLAAA